MTRHLHCPIWIEWSTIQTQSSAMILGRTKAASPIRSNQSRPVDHAGDASSGHDGWQEQIQGARGATKGRPVVDHHRHEPLHHAQRILLAASHLLLGRVEPQWVATSVVFFPVVSAATSACRPTT